MDAEIAANAHKGDWRAYAPRNPWEGIAWLAEHTAKLTLALRANDRDGVREYAADTANIAMKLEEVFGTTIEAAHERDPKGHASRANAPAQIGPDATNP